MIKHILFPSDASQNSHQAFRHLVMLAKTLHSKITLLHNYALLNLSNTESLDGLESDGASLQEIESQLKVKGLKELKRLKKILESESIACELHQVRGHVGEQIIKTARDHSVDLILMGSRGLDSLDSFTQGSSSTYVLHNSECPVLIVPLPVTEINKYPDSRGFL